MVENIKLLEVARTWEDRRRKPKWPCKRCGCRLWNRVTFARMKRKPCLEFELTSFAYILFSNRSIYLKIWQNLYFINHLRSKIKFKYTRETMELNSCVKKFCEFFAGTRVRIDRSDKRSRASGAQKGSKQNPARISGSCDRNRFAV